MIFINSQTKDLEEFKKDTTNEDIKKLVYANMLCNDTKISTDNQLTGDPTETALVDMGFKLDFEPSLFEQMPRLKEIPFDSDRKLMTTVNKVGEKYVVCTKGGVDELLNRCTKYILNDEIKTDLEEYKKTISENNEEMAKNALRVLAMGYKELNHEPTEEDMASLENDLIYIGMVGRSSKRRSKTCST